MRKILAVILAVVVIMSMSVTAYAYTPKLTVPKIPQISNIKFEVKLDKSTASAVEDQASSHVESWMKNIDFSKIDFSGIKLF